MKRGSLYLVLAAACTVSTLGANAETIENFNSRNKSSLNGLKAYLQDQCWLFRDFEINRGGWNPQIDGDGAMVSGIANNLSTTTAITTPLIKVDGSVAFSFDYKFNKTLASGATRTLRIVLTDANGNPVQTLDEINFTQIDASKTSVYSKSFAGIEAGNYKLSVSYHGINGNTRIAIDNLKIDAEPVYNSGCKAAPVATADDFYGAADRTASGNLFDNDLLEDRSQAISYTVANSADGAVKLNKDGSFEFTPNAGFTGNTTSFTYKVCETGNGALCSEDTKVNISFPEAVNGLLNDEILPQSLHDFKGFYQENGKVEIRWVTNFEQNSERFEVERSFDGAHWVTAGTMKGQGVSTNQQPYTFVDEVGRNTAHKNDLYYRLRQVNTDKKSSVSRILVVRVFNKRALKMVSVTPNPVRNDISVNVQLNENSFVVMKIVNKDGNEMMRRSQRVEEGQNSFVMDGSHKLTPGMYYLEVTVNSKDRMVAKLLKE